MGGGWRRRKTRLCGFSSRADQVRGPYRRGCSRQPIYAAIQYSHYDTRAAMRCTTVRPCSPHNRTLLGRVHK